MGLFLTDSRCQSCWSNALKVCIVVSISVFVCFGSKLLLSAVLSFAASPGGRAMYTLSPSFSRRVFLMI